ERLLPQPIAREHEAAASRVPHGEREHPVEQVYEVRSVLLIEVREHLRVAARSEAMTERFEIAAQRGVVVDLAVADGERRPVLVLMRLSPAEDVDDREAPTPEPPPPFDPMAVAVGTAMDEGGTHASQRRRLGPSVGLEEAVDATHAVSSRCGEP